MTILCVYSLVRLMMYSIDRIKLCFLLFCYVKRFQIFCFNSVMLLFGFFIRIGFAGVGLLCLVRRDPTRSRLTAFCTDHMKNVYCLPTISR